MLVWLSHSLRLQLQATCSGERLPGASPPSMIQADISATRVSCSPPLMYPVTNRMVNRFPGFLQTESQVAKVMRRHDSTMVRARQKNQENLVKLVRKTESNTL